MTATSSFSAAGAAPPYMLMSLLPLPFVPAALARSKQFDLAVSTAALFLSFLLHDALQETFYHKLALHAPVAITSLDFCGCSFWAGIVTLATRRARNASAGSPAASKTSSSQQVQIELVRVSHTDDSPDAPRIRNARHTSTSPSPTAPSSAAPPATPWSSFLAIGLMILLSNFLGVVSLSWVDYPLKVIIRSTKLVPTMLIGRMLLGKQYTPVQYIAACTLSLGVVLFSFADMESAQISKQAAAAAAAAAAADLAAGDEGGERRLLSVAGSAATTAAVGASSTLLPLLQIDASMAIGIALLCFSVIVDAANPNIAEKFLQHKPLAPASAPQSHGSAGSGGGDNDEDRPLLSSSSAAFPAVTSCAASAPAASSSGSGGHAGPGSKDPHAVNHFMFKSNVVVLPILFTVLAFSDELPRLMACVKANPSVPLLFALYCTASYCGVHAYTSMIQRHGSVVTVGMATLRKICTIVLSYVFISSSSGLKGRADSAAEENFSPPAKNFGAHHLLPSALIVSGLLISAWSDRHKHGAAGGKNDAAHAAHAADASSRASPVSAHPNHASGGGHSPPPNDDDNVTPNGEGELASVRALAQELGLETGSRYIHPSRREAAHYN